MNIQDVLQLDITNRDVLIIGYPTSGKTYLSKLLNTSNHTVFHSDDYMKYGYKEGLYVLIDDIKNEIKKTIFEGVFGYRLLRKGVELNCYHPDIVIQLDITEQKMLEIYKTERDSNKISYLKKFNKMHDKILQEYANMPKMKRPAWYKVVNDY